MSNAIYTATGCVRCKITKGFMAENGMDYQEFDFKGEGKDEFAQFYRANRKNIFRDQDGVEFPVFSDGREIRQGVSVILGYLVAGDRLDGFIKRSLLHGDWIDGFDVSGGDPDAADDLIRVLSYLKGKGLKLQLASDGRNAGVLQKLLAAGLGDRLVMEVKGPEALFPDLYGPGADPSDIRQSIALAAKFPDYRLVTSVAPLRRADGQVSLLTPEEIGQTAQLIEEASGSKKNPYTLRPFRPEEAREEEFKALPALPSSAMFKYRSAARRFQVLAEVEKEPAK